MHRQNQAGLHMCYVLLGLLRQLQLQMPILEGAAEWHP